MTAFTHLVKYSCTCFHVHAVSVKHPLWYQHYWQWLQWRLLSAVKRSSDQERSGAKHRNTADWTILSLSVLFLSLSLSLERESEKRESETIETRERGERADRREEERRKPVSLSSLLLSLSLISLFSLPLSLPSLSTSLSVSPSLPPPSLSPSLPPSLPPSLSLSLQQQQKHLFIAFSLSVLEEPKFHQTYCIFCL